MISVQNLTFTYPRNQEQTVRGIDFRVAEGESFGFLGPSGAGKSTTQKILIRLLHGFEGNIEVLGKPLQSWSQSYFNHIGVGFELPNHYLKLTARENLRLFASLFDKPCKEPGELLQMVGLEKHADQKVGQYSKGMRMRLNFVRAFMHDPEILFFDEPTSGLDPVNARAMKDIIHDLKRQGKTIFITTHLMQDADELCDRVAFLLDGRIEEVGKPHELKLRHGQRKVRISYGNGKEQLREFPLDGLGEDPEFLRILKEERIETIHSEEATLEDVFIKVTGSSLRP